MLRGRVGRRGCRAEPLRRRADHHRRAVRHAWQSVGVTDPAPLHAAVGREIEAYVLADVAARLDIPRTAVSQMIKQGQLLGVRDRERWLVPAAFITDEGVVKGLPGLITVLRDGGYTDAEILRWLFAEDETLPGAPIEALRADRGGEVKRRAQALAF